MDQVAYKTWLFFKLAASYVPYDLLNHYIEISIICKLINILKLHNTNTLYGSQDIYHFMIWYNLCPLGPFRWFSHT